jgi:hypothetical protein
MNKYVTMLFYVDDILVFYKIEHKTRAQRIITQIRDRYNIRNNSTIKWFLGVKVIKDRNPKRIFLTHDAYIEKVARSFALDNNASKKTFAKTPKVTINLRNLKLQLNNYHRQKQRVRLHLIDRSQARRRQNADRNGAYGR